MQWEMRIKALGAVASIFMIGLSTYAISEEAQRTLAAPESFANVSNTATRSAAMFTELSKVLTHPRCVNCHPAGDRPRQGDEVAPAGVKGQMREFSALAAVDEPAGREDLAAAVGDSSDAAPPTWLRLWLQSAAFAPVPQCPSS